MSNTYIDVFEAPPQDGVPILVPLEEAFPEDILDEYEQEGFLEPDNYEPLDFNE